jgi:hypothetical protein
VRLVIPWMLGTAALWWITFESLATGVEPGADTPAAAIRVGIAFALSFKLLGSLAEAGFYSGWWALRDARVPFGALLAWLLGLSLLDALAMLLPWAFEPEPGLGGTMLALVCGPRALATPEEILGRPELALFGPLGLLTVARIALTAHAQARLASRPFAGPLALTTCTWLAVRVATWWLGELLRGQSAAMLGDPA